LRANEFIANFNVDIDRSNPVHSTVLELYDGDSTSEARIQPTRASDKAESSRCTDNALSDLALPLDSGAQPWIVA
jgi:hypothetical protein